MHPPQSVPLRIVTEQPFPGVMPVNQTYKPHHDDCERSTDDVSERVIRGGVFVLLLLSISFILLIVVVFAVSFTKMANALEKIDGHSVTNKLEHALDHVVGAAEQTETMTVNAVAMSVLAREAAEQAQPKMLKALNETADMMREMRAFSGHPSWTVSAGSLGGRKD